MTGTAPAGDPWAELLDAWLAWTRTPSDRGTATRFCEASTVVAPAVGVPAYRVCTVLADGLRDGLTYAESVDRLRPATEETA